MYFLDTYAMMEIIKGHHGYEKYLDRPYVSTHYNLMELYYSLLRLYDEKIAEKYYGFFKPCCVPVSERIIKAAMKFLLQQRKKRNLISYVDCIGYFVALDLNVVFLSGDKHFKSLKNVEFIA